MSQNQRHRNDATTKTTSQRCPRGRLGAVASTPTCRHQETWQRCLWHTETSHRCHNTKDIATMPQRNKTSQRCPRGRRGAVASTPACRHQETSQRCPWHNETSQRCHKTNDIVTMPQRRRHRNDAQGEEAGPSHRRQHACTDWGEWLASAAFSEAIERLGILVHSKSYALI